MKKQFEDILVFGAVTSVLLFGRNSCESMQTEVYRGTAGAVEVKDADSNLTKVPETEIFQAGAVDSAPRCFDLVCLGECRLDSGKKLDLLLTSADKTPSPIALNENGKLIFAEPRPMGTFQTPAGYNAWVQVKLVDVSVSEEYSEAKRYVSLGIRRRGENRYIDRLYMPYAENASEDKKSKNHPLTYVDVMDGDVFEFVPLLSGTDLQTAGYSDAPIGGEISFDGINGTFDFGAVYRVLIKPLNSMWLKNQKCDLPEGVWNIGVGKYGDENSREQLLAVNESGRLSVSFDGSFWKRADVDFGGKGGWTINPACGNNILCIINNTGDVLRMVNGEWSPVSSAEVHSPQVLTFGNGRFMTVSKGENSTFYTSFDGEIWRKRGAVNLSDVSILCYGNNYWICAGDGGIVYKSEDDGLTWTNLNSNPAGISLCCGCYANGYFYAVDENQGIVERSQTGSRWEEVVDAGLSNCFAAVPHSGKLYVFSQGNGTATAFSAGLFDSSGEIRPEK